MKIILHIDASVGFGRELGCEARFAERFGSFPYRHVVSDEDSVCHALFERSASYEPKPGAAGVTVPVALVVATSYELEPGEWGRVEWFEPVLGSRQKAVEPSDNDANRNSFLREPLVNRGGWAPVRIASTIVYSKSDVDAHAIVDVGEEWGSEYVVGTHIPQAFNKCGLRGFETRTVYLRVSDIVNTSCAQLYSEHFTAGAIVEATAWDARGRTSDGKDPLTRYVRKGLLCLPRASVGQLRDINRTADPVGANNGATWVVSRATVRCVAMHSLKGWWFLPVLSTDSSLYEDYLRRMRRIESWVSNSKYNIFSCTRGGGIAAERILRKRTP